jgi:glycolate oxidase iron-sulfur subunit
MISSNSCQQHQRIMASFSVEQRASVNAEDILGQADSCVKCGLCLSHCPTYRKQRDESESPRGRISLVQGILAGPLDINDARVRGHLSRCLQCRACETVCPSEVAVITIMDGIRARQQSAAPWWRRRMSHALLSLLTRPAFGIRLHNLYLRSRLRRPLRALGMFRSAKLKAAERLIARPAPLHPPHGHFAPSSKCVGRVALFPGCIGRHLDATATAAAITLLTRLGFATFVPAAPLCCGAAYRHAGFPDDADAEQRRCAQVFDQRQYDAILGFSSACTGELAQDPQIGHKVRDINRFLADARWPDSVCLQPLAERISVHVPCTQQHLLRDADAALHLLQKIPGIDLRPLPSNPRCCGAAGTYLLREPAVSQSLLQDTLSQFAAADARYLVTSNIGCALHLAAGLREQGLDGEVCHPIQLIARQLP